MQSISPPPTPEWPEEFPTWPEDAAQSPTNWPRLDLDWLGQQPVAALEGARPALLQLLAAARADLGADDPFGEAVFAGDTPVVVLLRALAHLAR